MPKLMQLTGYLDSLLECQRFSDACPNGLQVEGRQDIQRLVTGVTASQALIDAAIDSGADAILVHHGYFWRGEPASITGMKKNRIAALLAEDISLLAYHLPLDCHSEYGNNVQFAQQLGIIMDTSDSEGSLPPLVRLGSFSDEYEGDQLAQHIQSCLGRQPLHIAANRSIQRVAWCTGAAQSEIEVAVEAGVDAYITGEASEQTVHTARESGIHFYAAGHHATERYGVAALGRHVEQEFGLEHEFIDIDNPV